MRKISVILVATLAISLSGHSNTSTSAATVQSIAVSTDAGKVEWAFTRAGQHPEQKLVAVINSSKLSLDIAIYSLTHPDVVKAIKEAKSRGVAVRIITDKQQSGGEFQTAALQTLSGAGIPIKMNKHSGLMHLKMTVADGKIATTGSFNYTKGATTINDEVFMVLRDEKIAKSFDDEFNKMWTDTKGFIDYK